MVNIFESTNKSKQWLLKYMDSLRFGLGGDNLQPYCIKRTSPS